MELWPLAELELLRLRPLRNRARWMLMKLGRPGENMLAAQPLFPPTFACGVPIMGSSWSSWSSGSSGSTSSEELLDSSEPIMLMLPMELDGAILSPAPHTPCIFTFGELGSIELDRGRFDGILMPFCVSVGDESGEDCAGTVEWWRLVQAREKSAPRDRRGSSEAGEAAAYVLRASSCGERGTRAAKWAGLGIGDSRKGIWSERPRDRKSGRRGVLGCATSVWSSLDLRAGSWNLGEGDRERAFSDRDRWSVLAGCGPIARSSCSTMVVMMRQVPWPRPLLRGNWA
jgi:hypothetical protein